MMFKRMMLSVLVAGMMVGFSWAGESTLLIKADEGKDIINRNIYGHFAEHLGHCIYGGLYVGEDSAIPNKNGMRTDVVEALKMIQVPVLRWPGGCFADEYHWRDGIGPKDDRPTMINTHWGGVTEDNSFGTHEFMELCEQLGCEPYVCGNVGSGTVEEMADWVEYMTFDGVSPMTELRKKNGREKPWKLTYFGVGNENWGCGGSMRPEYYADLYRRYQTYVRNFSGNRIFKIACGPSGGDMNWMEVMMREAGRHMNGIAPHYYCWSGNDTRSATKFEEDDWFAQLKRALNLNNLLVQQKAIMDKYDREKRVAIMFDEWGAWHEVEPGTNPGFLFQQNSLRDAMVAGSSLNIFNNHCDRVKMANIAQMVNVLQAMVLTDDEKMVLTPTYYVYQMYTVHHDATMLPTELKSSNYTYENGTIPAVNVSASKDKAGVIHVSLCNLNPNEAEEVTVNLKGVEATAVRGTILTSEKMTDHNTFEKPDVIEIEDFKDCQMVEGGLEVTLPAKSVVMIEIK